jgi:hypothetical protein
MLVLLAPVSLNVTQERQSCRDERAGGRKGVLATGQERWGCTHTHTHTHTHTCITGHIHELVVLKGRTAAHHLYEKDDYSDGAYRILIEVNDGQSDENLCVMEEGGARRTGEC